MEKRIGGKINVERTRAVIVLSLVLVAMLGVSVRAEEPDYGNDCNSAAPIEPNGIVVEGELTPSGDEDWFSFTASAEGLYEIAFLSQSGYKYLYLYGPDGCPDQLQLIASIYNYGGGWVVNEVFVEMAGTYYVQVSYGSGLYGVSVNQVYVCGTDIHPDTCDDPCELVVGAPAISACITDWGMDEDWLTFATEVLHKYQVSLYRPLNTDVVYDLYRTNCAAQLSAGCSSSITFVSLDGANYDLRLRSGSFNKEGYYEIFVEDLGEVSDDYGNSCDVATTIVMNGDPCQGFLQYSADLFSDEDWFSFTASADGLYEIAFLSQSGYKYLYLYGPDGCPDQLQLITSIYNYGGGWVVNEVFVEMAGTYYVKVSNGSGLYKVGVSEVYVCGTDIHPDTCEDPCELVVGAPAISACITDLGMDEDWFTFATSTLHKYRVNLYRPLNTDVVYDLYRTNCAAQLSARRSGSTTFVSLDGANYDLRLHSDSFSKEGYYEIFVEDLGEVPDDYGNSCDVAITIATNGQDVNGVLQYSADLFSDEDWFSFTASADGLHEIAFFSQSGYKYLYLYGPDGCPDQLQLITSIYNYGGWRVSEVLIETAGTYYVRISDGSGLYQVHVLSPEPQCGDPLHPYPEGDLNHDCVVNFLDMVPIADNWLADNRP